MKKSTFKFLLFFSFSCLSLILTAQTVPDEDTNPDITCPASNEFRNPDRTAPDLPNAVNVGSIDDRTCYADYSESNVYGKTWGVYNITTGSNHFPESLQPRIERSLPRSQTTGVGSYARFTGTVRILEVGVTDVPFQDGSYIMQAKGKHTGGGGSPDPAICLFLAMPIYGSGANSNVQVSFETFREQIVNREGQREFVFLTNIAKNVPTDIELEVGFRQDPSNPSKKIHYADAVIGGQVFNWNIPEPERGIQSGIRYGAYRVKGGRAQIRWADTTYEMAEVEAEPIETDDPDLTEGVYSLKNVATGKFLTDVGLAATPVTMSDSDEAQNTHWTFVNSGAFFNIDSETFGILRAPGSGGPGGPYVILSTERPSPESTSDKLWSIIYNESDETFRFESSSGRYLYHEANGSVTHNLASETDNRSKWEAIPTSESLSIDKNEVLSSAIRVFPNPANDNFTIALKNLGNVKVKIIDVLGKTIYESQSSGKNLQINNDGRFKSGIYLIKVIDNTNRVYHTRLVIK
ncbi:T9SS type A sorting domain-containing protein [Seonamhaeicola maritimus]|uniref:T9SS type A sorting domain-containing protein n=1 Tax=Seonamhaeicola maritimus TaxID=2591822 RepID=UPI002493FBAB|nr:T9SS type A sorting domain-containing protein [Seonamhaeicola maritimus]